jgi:hypothetical protein
MYGTIKAIRETKNGNDLYKVVIAEDLIVETDEEVQVTRFNAEVVDAPLAKTMQKAIDAGKQVRMNFEVKA